MDELQDTADVVLKHPATSPWYVDDDGIEYFAVGWYCVFGGVEYGNILAGTTPVTGSTCEMALRVGRRFMAKEYGWVPRYGEWRPWG